MKTMTFQIVAAALIAAGAVSGCKPGTGTVAPAKVADAAPGSPSADTVVATWGEGQKVTYGELNERLKAPLEALARQEYALREKGLEGMVTEALVKAEAKKQGLSEEDYLKAQIDAKVKQPTEVEIKTVFAKSKEQLPKGTTFESIKPKIVDFLVGREKQQLAQKLFAKLRTDAHVQFSLPRPPGATPAAATPASTKPGDTMPAAAKPAPEKPADKKG